MPILADCCMSSVILSMKRSSSKTLSINVSLSPIDCAIDETLSLLVRSTASMKNALNRSSTS